MGDQTVTIRDNQTGKSIICPVKQGTHGYPVIQCQAVASEFGMFTFDPAYSTTASCESKITYIDGEKGILLHRGYPIEQLAEKSSYMEVCYLLLHGELPNQTEMQTFQQSICEVSLLHEGLIG